MGIRRSLRSPPTRMAPAAVAAAMLLTMMAGAASGHEGCSNAHSPKAVPQPPAAAAPPFKVNVPTPPAPAGARAPSPPRDMTMPLCKQPQKDKADTPMILRPSIRATAASPAIVEDIIKEFGGPNVTNLAAGCSWWTPPDECIHEARELLLSNSTDLHGYGDGGGLLELREALLEKLERENGIVGKEVMVTAGANQAFVNAAQTLLSEGDRVVLFAPYYFSHEVALQLLGCEIIVCESDAVTGQPDVEALCDIMEDCSAEEKEVKMVVMCTVGNPSGVVVRERIVAAVEELCRIGGAWLVSDETYEYFTYGKATHHSPNATEGVINIYSFSKAYGMPGWRVGYMAYPKSIQSELEKVQDTIITMPTILSQRVALMALKCGREWVNVKIKELSKARDLIWDAVVPLRPVEPNGAFYIFVPIPRSLDEAGVVKLFATEFKILLVPGSAFGMENHMRVSYGSIKPSEVEEVAKRLMKGFSTVCSLGLRATWSTLLADPTANGRDGQWAPPLMPQEELIKREEAARGRSHTDDGHLHAEDH